MGENGGGRTRAVGVRDVAALAKVSRQTVSRVLNEHPDVAAETRERVLRAMGQLDYRLNNAARALGTSRSRTIGVLASDVHQYGPLQTLAAIESSARAAGYWVSTAFADSTDGGSVIAALDHLRAQSVDALVAFAPYAETVAMLDARELDMPTVMLLTADPDHGGSAVDQRAAARIAVAELADAGHRRIAHLAGPEDWLESAARAEGFTEELAARGLPPGQVLAGDWTPRAGYEAAAAVRDSDVTAVFAANDQMALGLINGLQALGVVVPDGVSVVGFDDIPEAAYSWPRLTTVRQDFEGLARRAVTALTGGEEAVKAVPELVRRDSVASPRR